jgi:hypothetical protein
MDYWKALGFGISIQHSSERLIEQLFAEHASPTNPCLVPFEGCTIQKGESGWFAVIDSPPQLLLVDGVEGGKVQAWSCLGEMAPLFPIELTSSIGDEPLTHGPVYASVWGYLAAYRSVHSTEYEPGAIPTSDGNLQIVGCFLENVTKKNVLTSQTVYQSTLWMPGLTIPVVQCQVPPDPGTFIEGTLQLFAQFVGKTK